MEEKKRTLLAVAISCIILVAVVYSFGVSLLRKTPEVVVADPNLESSQTGDTGQIYEEPGISIEVTPETVQSVIADMDRYTSYYRTLQITYGWGEGDTAAINAQVWVDGSWSRCDAALVNGMTEHSILGEDTLWYWYDDSNECLSVSADRSQQDLLQYIPTYEDVLALDKHSIRSTGYVEKNGEPCIYVEVVRQQLGYFERYWISETSGLLVSAETEKDGVVVYAMSSGDIVTPLTGEDAVFVLPDGTELHRNQS